MRRALAIATAAVAILGTTSAAVAALGGGEGDGDSATPSVPTGTATVTRRTLLDQEELDGTLGYADLRTLVNAAPGTITRMAAEGSIVDRGQVLYEVDGAPVPLLFGERPAYRELGVGVPDGPDIRQLEENLIALGMAKGLFSTPGSHFDSATEAAVKRWQKALGVAETGRLGQGGVVFLPGTVRIGEHKTDAGEPAQPGKEVAEVTSTTRTVTVDLPAKKQARVKLGDKVDVELPDGKRVGGTVSDIAKVARSSSSNSDEPPGGDSGSEDPTITVTITLDDASAAADLAGAPVDVLVTRERREGVLAVPVTALLALAEGGYGVEVRSGAGTRLVGVDPGLFSDGWVEVGGDDLAEGDRVVVPA